MTATLNSRRFAVTLNTSALNAALARLIEANAAYRKRRALAPSERALTAKMRRAFLDQGRAFLSRFAALKRTFVEVAAYSDWGPLFDAAALATIQAFRTPLDEFTAAALAAGMTAAIADLDIDAGFTLKHPDAVAYLQQRGAARVTQITETTRTRLRTLLARAADEGWPYSRTAKEIKALYAGFAGPPLAVRPRHIGSRAAAIAVYELGDAYEHGNMLVAKNLQKIGLQMEKSWLSAGDARVRPEHAANDAQGWIPLDASFQDGSDRPPTDSGCRCTLLMRRKPDA